MRDTYCRLFFFFNDTATTEIYTLSLHDALPILLREFWPEIARKFRLPFRDQSEPGSSGPGFEKRSEEHTSELQSQSNLVCRLLLEKKKHQFRCDEHLWGEPINI